MTQISLGNGFYQSSSLPISAQQLTNYYVNIPQSDALSDATLLPTPGLSLLTTTGTSNRGGIEFLGNPYVINTNTLSRIDETIDGSGNKTYSAVSLGTIEGVGRISIAKNNTQIAIVVPGGKSYIFSIAGGLVEITDVDFDGPANTVNYINSVFVFTRANKFFNSAVNDGLNYDALDFGTAEVDPDDIVGAIVYKNQLYILGTNITEVFDFVGGADFPFLRIEGFIIDKGLASQFAVVEFDDTFIFLGGGKNEKDAIWRVEGSRPVKVSHTAIDTIIQQSTAAELATAFAITYSQNGAYFVAFSFLSDTFVFDSIATAFAERPIWHKRESTEGPDVLRWRVSEIIQAFGRLIVADSFDGSIGALEPDVHQEYGNDMTRVWSSSPIAAGGAAIFFNKLVVTVESGTSSQGNEAFLGMAISEDGGKTYGDEVAESIGKIGRLGQILEWDRLGRYDRFITIRLRFSSNNKSVIIRVDGEIDFV